METVIKLALYIGFGIALALFLYAGFRGVCRWWERRQEGRLP